jgi:anti-sigma B factor antagonist
MTDTEPARFSVEAIGRHDSTAILAVTGEVDTFTSSGLRDALNEAIDSGAVQIILDVSDMEFIDSTGLGVLVGALKRVRERDGSMTLRKPRQSAMQVLSIVGLTSHFEIEE